jgi:hypothetical protein
VAFSGFVLGIVHRRRIATLGIQAANRRIWGRAVRVYLVQFALVLSAALAARAASLAAELARIISAFSDSGVDAGADPGSAAAAKGAEFPTAVPWTAHPVSSAAARTAAAVRFKISATTLRGLRPGDQGGGSVDDVVSFVPDDQLVHGHVTFHFDLLAGEVDLDRAVGEDGHLQEPFDGDLGGAVEGLDFEGGVAHGGAFL